MAKQMRIAGTEGRQIKEVDDAAEAYVSARDARMAKTEKETEAREALIGVLKKHKLTVYRDDDASPPLLVTLAPGVDKVKVTRVEAEDGEEEKKPRGRRVTSAAQESLPAGDRD